MIKIKYVDPISKNDVIEELDDSIVDVGKYSINLHKTYLCKDECYGENCKIWQEVNDRFILVGVQD